MAVEQDWAAYADQAYLALTDTLLLRTSAGAGVEVAGSHVFARRTSGGPFTAEGDVNVGSNLATAAAGLRYFDVTNTENTNGASGTILRLITRNAAGSALTAANLVKYKSGLFQISNDEPGGSAAIAFAIAGTERARIGDSGAVYFGTTTQLNGSFTSAMNLNCGVNNGLSIKATVSSYSPLVFTNSSGVTSGSIGVSGSSTAYNTSSDHRLKDDYQPLTGALDRILSLPVYDFRWIASGERARGFKAHEYGDVIPGAATGQKDGTREEEYEIEPARASDVLGPDGVPVMIPAVMGKRTVPDYQGIDQSKAVPDLVGAVQELAAMVTALRAEVAAMKAA